MKPRAVEALVGLVVGALLLLWVLRGFSWGNFWQTIREHWGWLLLAGGAMTLAHFLRAWRWQLMLRSAQAPTPLSSAWWALMIGYLANAALPRVGEVLRCTLLWRWREVPFPVAIGTVIAERLIDIFILLLLSGSVIIREGLRWLEILGLKAYMPYILAGMVIAGIGVGLSWRMLRRRAMPWIEAGMRGFQSLWATRPLWLMVVLSVMIWAGYWGAIWGVMQAAAPQKAALWAAWVLLVGSGLAMALPVPGGIGTFHAIGLVLLVMLGWETPAAQNTVFVAHTLQTLLILALGSVGFLWSSYQNVSRTASARSVRP